MARLDWYPGHMVKAQKQMAGLLRAVDLIIQVLDARAPASCLNPRFDRLFHQKKRCYLIKKGDLADERGNQRWVQYLKNQKKIVFQLKKTGGPERFLGQLKKQFPFPNLHAMVVGVPNAGKSTLINQLAGKRVTRVQDRAGTTRDLTWLKTPAGIYFLDSPGVLWPEFSRNHQGQHLGLIGSVKWERLPVEELARYLLEYLLKYYPDSLAERYKLDPETRLGLEDLGRIMGILQKGGEVDWEKTCERFLHDFRRGLLGPVTLEWPPEKSPAPGEGPS